MKRLKCPLCSNVSDDPKGCKASFHNKKFWFKDQFGHFKLLTKEFVEKYEIKELIQVEPTKEELKLEIVLLKSELKTRTCHLAEMEAKLIEMKKGKK